MPQSLANVLVHIVFSTRDRKSLIPSNIEDSLHRYVAIVCADNGCLARQIGGMPDHIHLLVSLSRNITISQFVNKVKSHSSRWIKKQSPLYKDFSWQHGYGAFSIGESGYHRAVRYIANQKEHHTTLSFKEEYLLLLKKYGVDYDERYLWE